MFYQVLIQVQTYRELHYIQIFFLQQISRVQLVLNKLHLPNAPLSDSLSPTVIPSPLMSWEFELSWCQTSQKVP